MKKYVYVAYGIDMEFNYAIVEVTAYNQEQAMNSAILKLKIAEIEWDTIEPFDRKFLERTQLIG